MMGSPRLVRAFLAGVLFSLWAASAGAGWYQDASRSYYVDLPESWIAKVRASERVLAVASPDGEAGVRVHVVPVEPQTRIESLKATFENTTVPGARQLAASPANLAGQQALEAQYAWAAGGASWAVTGRFLIAEKFGRALGYIVWSMSREGAAAARVAEGGRLLDSFSLLRPRGALEVGTALPEVGAPTPEAAFLLGEMKAEPAPPARPEPAPVARAEPPAPAKPEPAQPPPAAATAEPASGSASAPASAQPPPAPAEPQREAGFVPPQRSAPADRPGGPSKCLDATTATDCACAVGDLRPAFTDLEQAFVKASPPSGELREAAARIRAETASTGGNCPAAAVGRATALGERVAAPEAVWIVDRLELLKVCTDRAIANIADQRGRPGLNKTLDSAVNETRMVKYDALLLLAEFERMRAERDAAAALVGEIVIGCRIVQGTR